MMGTESPSGATLRQEEHASLSFRDYARNILFHCIPPLKWQWKIMYNIELCANILKELSRSELKQTDLCSLYQSMSSLMKDQAKEKIPRQLCNLAPSSIAASDFIDFRGVIRDYIGKNDQGIEIGPLAFSIAPKRDGYNVLILDCAMQDELRERYRFDKNVRIDDIEEVDAVDDGRDFSELLAVPEHSLHYVISSHNIEHLPDPISFLLRCERILSPDGRLFLIVPDKRGTFDYFRPLSTTGQLLEAYHNRRKHHLPSALFDTVYSTMGNGDSDNLLLSHVLKDGYSRFEHGLENEFYIDTHAWIFTLSSFLLLIHELRELGIIHLGIEKYYNRQNNEFFVIMSPGKHELSFSRQELLERIVFENINLNRKYNYCSAEDAEDL